MRKGSVVVRPRRAIAIRSAGSWTHRAVVGRRPKAAEVRGTAVLEATGAVGEEGRASWLLLVWEVAVEILLACGSKQVPCYCDEVPGNNRRSTDKCTTRGIS